MHLSQKAACLQSDHGPNEHVTVPPPSFEERRFFYQLVKFRTSGALRFRKLRDSLRCGFERQQDGRMTVLEGDGGAQHFESVERSGWGWAIFLEHCPQFIPRTGDLVGRCADDGSTDHGRGRLTQSAGFDILTKCADRAVFERQIDRHSRTTERRPFLHRGAQGFQRR